MDDKGRAEETGGRLYSELEAAARLRVSHKTVRRMRQAGLLGFYRIGVRVIIAERHIQVFLADCERKAVVERVSATLNSTVDSRAELQMQDGSDN
jgi:excisionase family DNA binding protein